MFGKPTYEELEQRIRELEQAESESRRADEVLQKSEERFRILSNDLPALVCEFLPDSTLTFVNNTYCEFFGMSAEKLIGHSFLDLIPEEAREDTKKQFSSLNMRKPVKTYTHEVIKNGKIAWQEWRDRAIFDEQGQIIKYHSIGIDITDRKRAEEEVRREKERVEQYLNIAGVMLATINSDEKITMMNKKGCEILGYKEGELIGKNWFDLLVPQELRDGLSGVFRKLMDGDIKSVEFYETPLITKDGEEKLLAFHNTVIKDPNGQITGVLFSAEDITERKLAEEERKKLQEQLNRAKKMEAIGTLAGGIAHNFNNILMCVQGRTSLMMMDRDPSDSDYKHMLGIEKDVKNAKELTSDLLGFARGGRYEVKPTDLNALIKHENRMFSNTRKEIRIQEKYEKDLWTVEADHGQIQQMLLNLYVNAWQAMPGGGNLYIQTENVTLDKEYIKPFAVDPGRYVKVSVTDTGVGMDAATREKIFDPFFTTKDAGQGFGLGLASVYGIIKNHGGFINVYSEKGEGTTFNIYLPVSEKETMEEAPLPDRHEIQYGRGTVLLVDDEEMIIEVGQAMLKKLGYRVLTAGSGQEALDLYGKQKGEIDLVLLDMIMPDMGGSETFDRLKAIDGNVRVLLSSGYSINGQAKEIMDSGCKGFIQKPFSIKDLSIKAREALDVGKSGTQQ